MHARFARLLNVQRQIGGSVAPHQWRPNLDGYHDPSRDLVDAVARRTAALSAENRRRRRIDREGLAAFQEEVRQAVLRGIGGPQPAADGPPGVERRGAPGLPAGTPYRIERLLLTTRPDVAVPANLYLPLGEAPEGGRPAVLFLCGHGAQAKAEPDYQRACGAFAAQGYVVLSFDPIGQEERHSYLDGDRHAVPPGTPEHTYAGLPCWWAGLSPARYFVDDARRALDHLLTREDVDPARVVATGSSGGGMLTTLLMALEPRLAGAAPATYVTSREAYLPTGGRQDAEQILLGGTQAGVDHDSLLMTMAPRPVCILAAQSDFFPIEGTLDSVERAREAWAVLGEPGNLELVVHDGVHRYHPELVDHAVRFFNRTLGHEPDRAFSAAQCPVLSPTELQCTVSGQVAREPGGPRFIAERLREEIDPLDPVDLEDARAWLRTQVLERPTPGADRPIPGQSPLPAECALPAERAVPAERALPAERAVPAGSGLVGPSPSARSGGRIMRNVPVVRYLPSGEAVHALWQSEPGIWGAGVLLRTERPPVERILLLDHGSSDLDGPDWQAHDDKTLVLDVRGRGVLAPHERDGRRPEEQSSSVYKILSDLIWLGDSLAAGQVGDVVRAIDLFAPDGVSLSGVGYGAYLARLTAFIDPRVRSLTVSEEFVDPDRTWGERLYDEGRGAWHGIIPGLVRRAPWTLIVEATDELRGR